VGITERLLCKQKNIPYHILQYWRDKCKSIPKASNAKFLPVTMPATITNAYKLKISKRPVIATF
jgi:hypothetical protein